ncbi:MAG TPA: hypothetical protein VGF84_02950, partial [Micromonosporaceae bacterium]
GMGEPAAAGLGADLAAAFLAAAFLVAARLAGVRLAAAADSLLNATSRFQQGAVPTHAACPITSTL